MPLGYAKFLFSAQDNFQSLFPLRMISRYHIPAVMAITIHRSRGSHDWEFKQIVEFQRCGFFHFIFILIFIFIIDFEFQTEVWYCFRIMSWQKENCLGAYKECKLFLGLLLENLEMTKGSRNYVLVFLEQYYPILGKDMKKF